MLNDMEMAGILIAGCARFYLILISIKKGCVKVSHTLKKHSLLNSSAFILQKEAT
jgi:hypothetical protein